MEEGRLKRLCSGPHVIPPLRRSGGTGEDDSTFYQIPFVST